MTMMLALPPLLEVRQAVDTIRRKLGLSADSRAQMLNTMGDLIEQDTVNIFINVKTAADARLAARSIGKEHREYWASMVTIGRHLLSDLGLPVDGNETGELNNFWDSLTDSPQQHLPHLSTKSRLCIRSIGVFSTSFMHKMPPRYWDAVIAHMAKMDKPEKIGGGIDNFYDDTIPLIQAIFASSVSEKLSAVTSDALCCSLWDSYGLLLNDHNRNSISIIAQDMEVLSLEQTGNSRLEAELSVKKANDELRADEAILLREAKPIPEETLKIQSEIHEFIGTLIGSELMSRQATIAAQRRGIGSAEQTLFLKWGGYCEGLFEELAEMNVRELASLVASNRLQPSRLTFAAEILGKTAESSIAIPVLSSLLSHESPLVREGAICGLTDNLTPDVRLLLETIQHNDRSPGVREAARDALTG